jgi:hypothetical protein
MLSIKKLKHVDDISFRERFGGISVLFFCFFLQNKICPFLAQGIWPFFFMKHSWTNFLNLSFSLEGGIVA